MPIYSSDSDDQPVHPKRLFGREKPLHAIFGGGKVADVLLWRDKHLSAAILLGFTTIWFLFEVVEYNFVTLISHIFIGAMVILFMWSTWAGFVDRAPPNLRSLTISESTFYWLFAKMNKLLLKFYDISSGRDLKTFFLLDFTTIITSNYVCKAITFLWTLSVIGNYFSSLNLLYTGFLCFITLPALYERYQNEVDYLASKGAKDMKKQFKKFDSKVLDKIPRGPGKERKRF